MKRLISGAGLALAMVHLASAQPSQSYVNKGTVNALPPNIPQIDALSFDNEGTFNIGLNNYSGILGNQSSVFFNTTYAPYDFSDVLTYTNHGKMSCDTGFLFNNSPAISGFPKWSQSFGNAGTITNGSVASVFTTVAVFFGGPNLTFQVGAPVLKIQATNIVNSGVLDVGAGGNLIVQGNVVNLARGTAHVEGFDDANVTSIIGNIGISDRYWGFGNQTNALRLLLNATFNFPGNLAMPYPTSPTSLATTAQGALIGNNVALQIPATFVNTNILNDSNICWQVVYINTNLNGISTDVRFVNNGGGFATPLIQWQAMVTNFLGALGQSVTTNYLYLSDEYGSFPTNYLVTNSFTFSGVPQPGPYNYTFYRTDPTGGGYSNLPPADTTFDALTIYAKAFGETNAYATYGVTVAPVTSFPDPTLPGSTVTNTPGRIEISANSYLDLTRANITGPNYLNVTSTNHFAGSALAQIDAPYMDVNLGTTNGPLAITNLVAPTVARFTGPIDMYSARWTNVVGGVTNAYHVLLVNPQLSPVSVPLVLNCKLRSDDVYVSDALNIDQSLLINTKNLTITSNGPASPTPYGEIVLLSGDLLWSDSLPVLQNVTNYGLISTSNATFFYNTPQTPYYPIPTPAPYQNMLNHGLIATSGNEIWANYFENTGTGAIITNSPYASLTNATTTSNRSAIIFSSSGPINLTAPTAILTSGQFVAVEGDINLTNTTLTVSNHDLLAGYGLTLHVTGSLSDGGAPSNFWSVGDGMNLPVRPTGGSGLLGSTITNFCPAYAEVQNVWAAQDAGASAGGFANNAAVGHLILNGENAASQFGFSGPDTNGNALYVDELELQNGATNRAAVNGVQIFTAFDIAPNFTIYYADATMNGADISEKLNGNVVGGHCVWVPGYAGTFSSTSVVYPGGITNTFNKALVMSTDIDSNGNGIPNAFDPTPIYTSSFVGLKVGMTNSSGNTPLIQWYSLANATNFLYYKTNLTATNWTLVTNFVQGPSSGNVTVVDRARATNRMGFYKVQVSAHQP